jgi:hypothetical protein
VSSFSTGWVQDVGEIVSGTWNVKRKKYFWFFLMIFSAGSAVTGTGYCSWWNWRGFRSCREVDSSPGALISKLLLDLGVIECLDMGRTRLTYKEDV